MSSQAPGKNTSVSMWVRCPLTREPTLIRVGSPAEDGHGSVLACERFAGGALRCTAECSWFAVPRYCKLRATTLQGHPTTHLPLLFGMEAVN